MGKEGKWTQVTYISSQMQLTVKRHDMHNESLKVMVQGPAGRPSPYVCMYVCMHLRWNCMCTNKYISAAGCWNNNINTDSYICTIQEWRLIVLMSVRWHMTKSPFFQFANHIFKQRVVVFFLLDDNGILIVFVTSFIILYEISAVNTVITVFWCVTL